MAAPIGVVIVDDDENVLNALEKTLGAAPGIRLLGVGRNGREAIQLVNKLTPDVVLLDIMMPVLNGLEAAARITSLFPQTAVAILTSEQSKEFMREAFRVGVREYIDKTSLRLSDLPGLVRQLALRQAPHAKEAPKKGLASVWSFYSPKGCAGTTTQAINASVELARFGYKVLLVDLDLVHGDVEFYLKREWLQGSAPKQPRLLANLSSMGTLEEKSVRRGIQHFDVPPRYASGRTDDVTLNLELLPSPLAVMSLDSASVQNLGSLLEFLTTLYDFVVLDLPPGRIYERATAISLDFSEKFFLVGNQDLSSLKTLQLFLKVLVNTAYSRDKVNILLSAVTRHPEFDSRQWLMKNAAGVGECLEIPLDAETVYSAIESGIPYALSAPESAAAQFSRTLVERALNQQPAPGRTASLWKRLQKTLRELVVGD